MESGSSATLSGTLSASLSASLDARGRADTLPTHASQPSAVERRSTSLTELLRSSLGRKKKLRIFGTSLADLPRHEHSELPSVVVSMVSFLSQHGLGFEGLFRISGSQAAVTALRAKIDKEGQATFPPDTSPAVVSSLLKAFLRELPEPVILPATLAQLVAVSQDGPPETLFERYRAALSTLPSENFALLSYLMELAARVVANKDATKMTPQSMATVLSPNLFGMESQDDLLASHGATNTLIATFITHYRSIFKPAVRVPTSHAGIVFDHDVATPRPRERELSFDEADEDEYEVEQLDNPVRIAETRVDSLPSTPGLPGGAMLSPHPARRSPRSLPDDPADRMLLAGGSTPSPTPDRSSPSGSSRRPVPRLASTIHDFLFGDFPAVDEHPLLHLASGRASALSNDESAGSASADKPAARDGPTTSAAAAAAAPTDSAAHSTTSGQSDTSTSARASADGAGHEGLESVVEEMRVLRHKIHDFDTAFERQHGRPPGHGDRHPIAREVARYKQLRRDRNAARDSFNASTLSASNSSLLDASAPQPSEQPVDVAILLSDRAKARMASWYTRNQFSAQETNDMAQLHQEKTELKRILSLFDREFIAEKGKEPAREDKAPLLALYQRYKRVKTLIAGPDAEQTTDPNASSASLALPAGQAALAATAPSAPSAKPLAPLPAIPASTTQLLARTMSAPTSVGVSVPAPPAGAATAPDLQASSSILRANAALPAGSAQPEFRRTQSVSEFPDASEEGLDSMRTTAGDIHESVRYAALKGEKHQLQKRLMAFEAKFKEENGRRVETAADRMPLRAEYARYKALKREIAVLELTSSQFSPNVTL